MAVVLSLFKTYSQPQSFKVISIKVLLKRDGSTLVSLELLFSIFAPRALELFQTLNALLHSALTVDFVIPGAHIHRVTRLLLLSHHFYRDTGKVDKRNQYLEERQERYSTAKKKK